MAPRILVQLMEILFALVRSLCGRKADLALEVLALRQQLAVLHRESPRPRLNGLNRAFWTAFKGQFAAWADALIIVKPKTVVRWHRDLFRRHWARLSGSGRRPGRPRLSADMCKLIRTMATENPTWGAPRVHAELLKLGLEVAEATISRYLPERPPEPAKIALWKAFLRNHLPETAAMDFVTIPTATFRVLYGLFVVHHDRRRILHFNVTENPTAAWVRQQLREVFLDDPRIRYLIHDRDTKFSDLKDWLRAFGVRSLRIAFHAPCQNGVAERWVGTLRRELLDHVVILNEDHARRLAGSFIDYYNRDRCHLSLNKDPPESRSVQRQPSPSAQVIALPRVGGIHHRYEWRDAA